MCLHHVFGLKSSIHVNNGSFPLTLALTNPQTNFVSIFFISRIFISFITIHPTMILPTMTSLALLLQLCCTKATADGGRMTRERFQTTVHTLVDDEMALLLKALVDTAPMDSFSSGYHRRTESAPSNAASSKLRGSTSDVNVGAFGELNDLFDSIVSHGWETILSRSTEDEEELFLVCHESSQPYFDRMQVIIDAFEVTPEAAFVETVHSTLETLCVILSLPLRLALNWYTSNSPNWMFLTLVPWSDVMKIAPGIISQLVPDNFGNNTSSYSIVFSMAQNGRVLVDDVVNDVIGLIGSGQSQRRQKEENNPLHNAFSLTKTRKIASESHQHWSRMLQDQECPSMLDDMKATVLDDESVYQLLLGESSSGCLVALVVGLSVHPVVSRVGTIAQTVELHNINAKWNVQGSATDFRGNEIFPFSAAGLDGKSQVVSISDTGLE
jgi:hypothetical protein